MTDPRLHIYASDISGISLPGRLNDPFCYEPHPLCLLAAKEVQAFIENKQEWSDELRRGKMFGVLAVRDEEGTVGFLAAFSGLLDGRNDIPYFVPPVYDMMRPDGFFKPEESNISAINAMIASLKDSPQYIQDKAALTDMRRQTESELGSRKAQMAEAKARRDSLRGQALTSEEEAALTQESQHMNAEYRRLEKEWRQRMEPLEQRVKSTEEEISRLKHERHRRSAALQERLFRHFVMRSYGGGRKDLIEIFDEARGQLPPAGSGECAAPKMLQYAFGHRMEPLAIAEFWWGESPKNEVRRPGSFYPACEGKCRPILSYMLGRQ